jgi:hypothetical protein
MSQAKPDQPPKKRRGAVDAFVAKDRVSVFWFLLACLTAGACSWYVVIVSDTMKERPPFVIMDGAGVFYSAPGVNFEKATPIHLALTEILVDTMFTRGPDGLAYANRLNKLCTRDAYGQINKLIQEESSNFSRQQVKQTYVIEEIKSLGAAGTAAGTQATGRIIRRGQFGGAVEEISTFKVKFQWVLNPNVRGNESFPALLYNLYSYERIPLSMP